MQMVPLSLERTAQATQKAYAPYPHVKPELTTQTSLTALHHRGSAPATPSHTLHGGSSRKGHTVRTGTLTGVCCTTKVNKRKFSSGS